MLVPLNSPVGTKRLEEASAESSGDRRCCDINNDYNNNNDSNKNKNSNSNSNNNNDCTSAIQQHVVESFRKQRGNTVCGLASLAVLLTARKRSLKTTTTTATPAREKNTKKDETFGTNDNNNNNDDDCCFVDEDDVYPMVTVEQPIIAGSSSSSSSSSSNNNNVAAVVVSEEKIRASGMTLDQVRALAEALPTTEKAIAFSPSAILPFEEHNTQFTNANNRLSLEGPNQLRTLISKVLSEPSFKEGLVLNYHMSTLGQIPFGGHLSPIAAYHGSSDSILVMDVWHTRTEPVWASVECVWKAISGTDSASGAPRGLLKLVHHQS
jgi:hypothetical protein